MPESPAAPSSIGATNAKPGSGDVAVTSTLQGGLNIASDGSSYTNSSSLKSVIASNGVWYPDVRDSNTRTVHLDFSGGIAGTGPTGGAPVDPGSANYKVFIYTACNFPNYGNVSLLTLTAGQTVSCPMAAQFDAGGKQYLLRMNSYQDAGTNDVNIRCASLTGPCSKWEIRPSVASGNRARLTYAGKGNAGPVQQGDYNMSFSIDVTNP
jgi:hypothetical protein